MLPNWSALGVGGLKIFCDDLCFGLGIHYHPPVDERAEQYGKDRITDEMQNGKGNLTRECGHERLGKKDRADGEAGQRVESKRADNGKNEIIFWR